MTSEFNISSRLRLQDPAMLIINNERIYKRVSAWIKENPLELWIATRTKGVKLVRNAHFELKAAIEKLHPAVFLENEKRKLQRIARKNVLRKLHN